MDPTPSDRSVLEMMKRAPCEIERRLILPPCRLTHRNNPPSDLRH